MAIGSRSSAEEVHPAWMRWLMPSADDAMFVAMLGVLTLTTVSVRLLGDAGIGWHIRTGELILANHAIPHVDPFSASMGGRQWFAWEWLYDVAVGALQNAAGLNGVVVFTAAIIALTFSWTFRLLLRWGTNLVLALALVLVAASAAMIHMLARPHVVSWFFTVAWFWILESSEKNLDSERTLNTEVTGEHRVKRRLWMLPVLMLVWVNVHGGFLMGFALLVIYWVGAVGQWLKPAGDRFEDILREIAAGRRVRTLGLVGVVSAAATLVNPYGWQLHVHIYRYLSNRFLMDHIDEFQSPNFHHVAQKCFAGLVLLTLVAVAAKVREIKVSQGLVLLLAIYAGLYASRNLPVSSLLLILVIGPWLSEAMERHAGNVRVGIPNDGPEKTSFLQRMAAINLKLRGHVWPIAAVVVAGCIAAHGGKLGSSGLMNAHFDGKRFPAAAVDYIETHGVQGPEVSPDEWGGYLIYRLYPKVKVVVDDRHDFYGEEYLKSYLKMVRVEPGWQDFLQRQNVRTVIVPGASALANILLETRGWQAVFADDKTTVFERTGP